MVSHAVAGAPNTLETRQPQMSALELFAQTSLGWASQGVEQLLMRSDELVCSSERIVSELWLAVVTVRLALAL